MWSAEFKKRCGAGKEHGGVIFLRADKIVSCDGRIICPLRANKGLFEIIKSYTYINTGSYGHKVHSDRDQKDTTENVALLVPNPFPLPLVSHQFACSFPFTKIMIAFSC